MDKKLLTQNLFELIASINNPEDLKKLFEDMCTHKEIEQMADRIYAARLLLEGKTYNQVTELCDISSATLSRVSRCVQYGEGYNKFLK
jgi:TrpR-related protein YerC/YecD